MQGKLSHLRTLVIVLIASIVLTACGGGEGAGAAWFNLPSIPVTVEEDGSASALGFNLGVILQPTLVEQLQAADVQALEIRVGHGGVFLFANGEPLPYLAWDDASFETLQDVLRATDQVQNGDLIANLLPWARRIGLGVFLALGEGAGDVERWRGGDVVAAPATVDEPTIGPINIGSVAVDEQGAVSIAGVPLSDLGAGVVLPPNVLQIFREIGAEQLTVSTRPNGIQLAAGNRPLPTIGYDAERLARAVAIAQPFLGDPELGATLAEFTPQLVGADIDLTVSLTGEPAGPTELAAIPLEVGADGTLTAYGLPVTSLPADLVQSLQEANVQHLYVNALGDNLVLAVNGELLPVIAWNEQTFALVERLAPTLGLPAGTVRGGLDVAQNLWQTSSLGFTLAIPPAEGADAIAVEEPPDISGLEAPQIPAEIDPDIQVGAVLDDGQLQSIAGLPASALADLGAGVPELPADVVSILDSIEASQLQILSTEGQLLIIADGEILLGLNYTPESLDRMLQLVAALQDDAAMLETVQTFRPLLTEQRLNLVVALDGGEAPPTRLAEVPLAISEEGELAVFGIVLGLGAVLPADLLETLQQVNAQHLSVDIMDDSLYLAVNGEALPVLSWNQDALAVVQQLLGSLLGVDAELLGAGLDLMQQSDVGLNISLPAAAGTELITPAEFDPAQVTFEAPELGELSTPVVQLGLTFQNGRLTRVGELPADVVRSSGVPIPDLPADVARILREDLGAEQLQLATVPNELTLSADGEPLLTLRYDANTLARALAIAAPFLPENVASQLEDPDTARLLREELLPLVVGADVDVTADLE